MLFCFCSRFGQRFSPPLTTVSSLFDRPVPAKSFPGRPWGAHLYIAGVHRAPGKQVDRLTAP